MNSSGISHCCVGRQRSNNDTGTLTFTSPLIPFFLFSDMNNLGVIDKG